MKALLSSRRLEAAVGLLSTSLTPQHFDLAAYSPSG